jgi:hypothetical protein
MVGQKWTAMTTKPASVATIAGDAEVDHAIATLGDSIPARPRLVHCHSNTVNQV